MNRLLRPSLRPIRRVAAGAVVMVVFLLGAGAAVGQPAPTASNPNRFAVTGGDIVGRLFRLADTRRVDFAIIGDSNVRNAVISGLEDGLSRAYSERFGCYATRVDPCLGVNSWGASVGGAATFGFAPFVNAGANDPTVPPAAKQFSFPTSWFPTGYAYLPAGVEAHPSYNGGLRVDPDHPIDDTRALRYHLTHYRMRTPTDGRLVLTARGPAYTNFAAAVFRTAASTPGLADEVLEIPAGPRDPAGGGLMLVPGNLVDNTATRGPFFGLWQRVEDRDRAAGISFSPLLYQGGRSARSACVELNAIGPASPALQEWLRQVTRLQHAAPGDAVLCIQIIHGGNDAGDENPSVGPVGGVASNTAAGHADNLRGIMNNLRAAWVIAGNDPADLYFILGPYHPRGDRLELQVQFEQQWALLCTEYPNTVAVRGTQLSTEDEFIALGWMASSSDYAHLSVTGYRAWSAAVVEALQRAACPADFNHDRAITVQDLFEFLASWFAGDAGADFDGSGAPPTLDDFFAFIAAWFDGC